MDRWLSKEDLFAIPQEFMPMIVLSDNLRNIVSAGIKAHTHGCYSHMMWLIAPGVLASMQTNGFKRVKLESFLNDDRLKLWWCPDWTDQQRKKIVAAIEKKLKLPWYKRRYDFLAYIGQLTGWRRIQSPWAEICSESFDFVKIADPAFNMVNPNPEEINAWMDARQPKYQVYGRYTPD